MSNKSYDLIITRHSGAIEWLARHLYPDEPPATREGNTLVWYSDNGPYRTIPIKDTVQPDDVCGRHVVGNLPLHLAVLANQVTAIEFPHAPPRGAEYTSVDMETAGAVLRTYRVSRVYDENEES